MKRTARATVRLLTIAVMATIGLGMSAGRAVAQTKNPLAPQLVRNIDEPGFNPYQHSVNTTLDASAGGCCGTVIFPIPTNTVVVVEHVSMSGGFHSPGIVQAFLRCSMTSDASQEVNHSLVLVSQGENPSNGFTVYSASQPIKCYASAPGSLSLHVQSNSFTSGQPIWVMAVSGYTVPR